MKFIYVFNETAKSKMLEAGFALLKEDAHGHVYVFVNNGSATFSDIDVSYIMSDSLSF